MSSKTISLYELTKRSEEEIYEILSTKSSLLHEKDENERFLLHWSALAGKDKLCEYILERHPEQRDAEDDMNVTPLILAALVGHLPTIIVLVRSGADINHKNKGGHSALQYACSKRHLNIVNYLLQMSANVNIADAMGDTPLHRAASRGYEEIVETLLSHNANPNIANRVGNTPLHLACEDDEQPCAMILIKRGASHTLQNAEQQTPLDLSSRSLLALIANEIDMRHSG